MTSSTSTIASIALFESQVNKAHETALIKKVKGTRISADQ